MQENETKMCTFLNKQLQNMQSLKCSAFLNTYMDINTHNTIIYEIMLVIPISFSTVEHSVSTQNRIKQF